MIERLSFGTAQVRPHTSRAAINRGDRLRIGLGVSATAAAELDQATAGVWTNYGADDPRDFREVPMNPVAPTDGHQRAFEVTLPPAVLGTFLVTTFVDVGGHRTWAADLGPANLVLRARSEAIDGLNVRQVPLDKVNARAGSTDISTIDDMLDDQPSRYSLAWLQRKGVNCVWVQVPYRQDLWDGLPAIDDAGSDYASTDWFSIDPELSMDARSVPSWDLDRQRSLANLTMRRFVDEAHARGMKVLFEMAPNHVGHNFIFRDDVMNPVGAAEQRRDYRQVTVSADQLAAVGERLALAAIPEDIKNYAEFMMPQLYAARYPDGTYNPFGANLVEETYSPDWYGRWADTKHLNHGGHAGQYIWVARTPQNFKVLDYIGRAMRWAVVELGADGFRIDHTLGMPYHFFEQILPWVEMEARRAGKASLIWVHEDHNRKDYSARVGDIVQSKGYEGLLHALTHQDAEGLWALYADPTLAEEFAATGNHDEVRGARFFPGNLLGYGNAIITMQLFGGPMTMLAGDEFGESEQLQFKARGGIPTAWQFRTGALPDANRDLAYWVGRGGTLKTTHPALQGRRRERLFARAGGGPLIVAGARFVDDAAVGPLLVFNNLSRDAWSTGIYDVGEVTRRWLERAPDAFYQIRDRLGFDPERPLWRRPLDGRQLLSEGLSVGLQPYQIQALELDRLA